MAIRCKIEPHPQQLYQYRVQKKLAHIWRKTEWEGKEDEIVAIIVVDVCITLAFFLHAVVVSNGRLTVCSLCVELTWIAYAIQINLSLELLCACFRFAGVVLLARLESNALCTQTWLKSSLKHKRERHSNIMSACSVTKHKITKMYPWIGDTLQYYIANTYKINNSN